MKPLSLNYAHQTKMPWLRRGIIQRRILWITTLIAILGLVNFAPFAFHYLQARLILRRCMNFTAVADKICFESDGAKSPLLALPGGEYRDELNHETASPWPVASWAPRDWVELIRCLDPTLKSLHFSPPLVFMHERKSADGRRRLVVLRYDGDITSEGGPTNHTFDFELVDPSGWPALKSVRTFQTTILSVSHPFSRIYFGQPDPADSSHFQLKYETEDGAGIIDGWLRNDHELSLECSDGPESGR